MRYVSKSVMTGFVNALAILIFMAQLPELNPANEGVTWLTYALVAAGLAIIYLFPRLTKAVPSPLVTIVVLTALVVAMGWDVRTVGDMGALPDTLPVFLIPNIPLNAYCPGVVGTDVWTEIDARFAELTGAEKGATFDKFVGSIALGRAQTPQDVASLVSYLAGPDSDYMTGQSILIDGGMVYR